MQSDNTEETNKEKTLSKPTTPQKIGLAELTFGRSPIKTPRSILKSSNNPQQNKMISRINKREEQTESMPNKSEINSQNCQNSFKRRRESVIAKIETNKRDNHAHVIPSALNQRNLAPKLFEEELDDQNDPDAYKKKKKDWKSWSLQEKELFYEAIANGGNYSSLQKLFKNMNVKIGTKSTEKIRDYYYRALKNVNKLLRSVGEDGINRKNRDEVLLALNCYGKMITSSNSKKKSNLDAMKKLNRHPRLFKKTALSLKKLIMRGVKSMRVKKISSQNINKQNKARNSTLTKNVTFKKEYKINNNPSMSNAYQNVKIIDPDMGRKMPYDKFTLKLTPYDHDSYFKMIESNYSARFEISIPFNKSLKHLIEILSEKWKNICKKHKSAFLFLCPLEDIWIPSEITFFSSDDSSLAYDIGDIYTAYGCPSTNVLLMHYQWADSPRREPREAPLSVHTTDVNIVSNSLLAQPTLNLENSPQKTEDSQLNMEDVYNVNQDQDKDDEEEEKENSFVFEQEFDEFDPLEFLGIYKSNKRHEGDIISSDGEEDDFELNKFWDEDDNLENIENIQNDDNDNDNHDNNDNSHTLSNKSLFNINSEINENDTEENKKQPVRETAANLADNNAVETNDPYKRVNYFTRMRNPNLNAANSSKNFASSLSLSDSFSSCNNIFIKNLNNMAAVPNHNIKSNLFSISEHEDAESGNFNKILNFQDIGSRMKSNTLSLSNSMNLGNNVNNATSSNNGNTQNNKQRNTSAPTSVDYANNNITGGLGVLNNNAINPTNPINANGNATSDSREDKSIEKSNENSCNNSDNKNSKRRINFENNFNKINENETSKNNNLDDNKSNSMTTPVANNPANTSINNPSTNSNVKNNVIPASNISEGHVNFSFFTNNTGNLSKSRNFENYLLNTFSSNANAVKTPAVKDEGVSNFNMNENSNIFNYTNHHHIGGIFDQESNFNLMRNYGGNNSMFYNDNMFNSNLLNTNFMRNVEDTMMKRISSSIDKDREAPNANVNAGHNEHNGNISHIITNRNVNYDNINNTASIDESVDEKARDNIKLLTKKSKRKGKDNTRGNLNNGEVANISPKSKNAMNDKSDDGNVADSNNKSTIGKNRNKAAAKKRMTPVNLDELLDNCANVSNVNANNPARNKKAKNNKGVKEDSKIASNMNGNIPMNMNMKMNIPMNMNIASNNGVFANSVIPVNSVYPGNNNFANSMNNMNNMNIPGNVNTARNNLAPMAMYHPANNYINNPSPITAMPLPHSYAGQSSNINISNTNPYIINQNNFFNGFNPNVEPRTYPCNNQMDIPHPSSLMGHVGNFPQMNANLQNMQTIQNRQAQQMELSLMMNNRMNNPLRFPPNSFFNRGQVLIPSSNQEISDQNFNKLKMNTNVNPNVNPNINPNKNRSLHIKQHGSNKKSSSNLNANAKK